ncbi:MAG: MFS transporter [Burkholderiales bacterium]|nr:MFS transporter [Burkholderiales bacterium]
MTDKPEATAAADRPDLGWAALLRLSCAYAIATNGTLLMPLFVGVLMRRFGIGDDAATGVAALEIGGIAISCAVFPRWIARVPRRLAWIATLGSLLAQAASASMPGLAAVGAARLVTGLFEGVLFVVVAASLSNRPAAERAWGVIVLASGVFDCALLVGAYALPQEVVLRWVFVIVAFAFALIAWPAAVAGNDALAPPSSTRPPPRAIRWHVLLPIWAVMALVYSVLSAQWALADVVGHRIGLPPERIGPLLALVSLLGTVGALAASHRRSHALRVPILWIAQGVMAGGVLWFFVVRGAAGFFAAQLLVSAAFYAVTPFLTSRLSGLDADGSLLSRSIVITFVAAFAGTALAGTALTRLGGLGCGIALGLCALVAMPFTWKAFGDAAPRFARPGRRAAE